MPRVNVLIQLPYVLYLQGGDYQTSKSGDVLRVLPFPEGEGMVTGTDVSADFDHPDTSDLDEILQLRVKDADRLLLRANRLIRWYRAVSRQAEVTELTRSQASPFRFFVDGAAPTDPWTLPLKYEATGPRPLPMSHDDLTNAVRVGLASDREPDVAELFLLDAERALDEGRFRETVLFCWSTIDSTFNRKYEALVEDKLPDEWKEGREALTAVDFGLRNKMTAVMSLVANRSLFREPRPFWENLSNSYKKRNSIIHRGESATEDDAKLALDVARRVVVIMDTL